MTSTDATPQKKKSGRPARGPKYPAQLAVMVTADMRHRLDGIVEETGASLGEVVRACIEDGFTLQEARAS